MINTFKMMNQVRMDKYKNVSNEDLAKEYRDNQSPSILAEVFCRNFSWWQSICHNSAYNCIDGQDKVDAVVMRIHSALSTFNGNSKFITYATKCITLELNRKLQYFTYKGRTEKVYSLDKMREDMDNTDFEENFDVPDYDEDRNAELRVGLSTCNLNDKEKLMCQAIMDNNGITNCELATMLGVHRHTVRNMKTALQTKLAFLRA